MFKGSNIPGKLDVPGVLDRTIWVYKHRYFPYGMIFLSTFGPSFLLMFLMHQIGIVDLQMNENIGIFFLSNMLVLSIFMYTLPSTISDVAMQVYTSYLVRDNEIHWWLAVKKSFSLKLLKYFGVKLIGTVILVLVSVFGSLVLIVPVVGPFAWIYLMIGMTTVTVGMSAAIIVEEKKGFISIIGRNFWLGRASLANSFNSSALGGIVMMAFVLSIAILFQSLAQILIAIFFADTQWFMMRNDAEVVLTNVILFFAPTVMLMIFVPLQSIFFSVLYYNMRSRREAFHLENRLNIYNKKFDVKETP